MNIKKNLLNILLLLTLLITFSSTNSAMAAPTISATDEVLEYLVTIYPQSDGTLEIHYEFQWQVLEDYAGSDVHYKFGIPNRHASIIPDTSYARTEDGENLLSKKPNIIQDGGSLVRVDLNRELSAGEVLQFGFVINQQQMAFQHPDSQEVTFQFIPGWFDDFAINRMVVRWQLPTEEGLLLTMNPEPTTNLDGFAIWETSLQPGEKFTVDFNYAQGAFPTFSTENAAPSDPQNPSSDEIDWYQCCKWILIIMAIVFIVWLIVKIIQWIIEHGFSSDDNYYDGRYYGTGYGRGQRKGLLTFLGDEMGTALGDISDILDAGGGGGFSGHGGSSSCASSCACACACAGGGRAGCSAKAVGIRPLLWQFWKHLLSEENDEKN